jgi:hypothetical protein
MFISRPENHPKPLQLSAITSLHGYRPDLTVYDSLTTGLVGIDESYILEQVGGAV